MLILGPEKYKENWQYMYMINKLSYLEGHAFELSYKILILTEIWWNQVILNICVENNFFKNYKSNFMVGDTKASHTIFLKTCQTELKSIVCPALFSTVGRDSQIGKEHYLNFKGGTS